MESDPSASHGEITLLLQAVNNQRPGAADRLMRMIYAELHAIARHKLSEAPRSETLQPTALVNEVYARLFGRTSPIPTWENRRHFFWAAARAMRDILVEQARRKVALKRGGGRRRLELQDDGGPVDDPEHLLALNEALERFQVKYPDAAGIVMLKFFGGLTRIQIAEALDISESEVWREWTFAKAWLRKELDGGSDAVRDAG